MLTPEQLNEIKQRHVAIAPLLPLTLQDDGNYLDGVTAEFDICTTEDDKPWVEVFVRDNEDLAKFIVNAPRDMGDLLAEIELLQAGLGICWKYLGGFDKVAARAEFQEKYGALI